MPNRTLTAALLLILASCSSILGDGGRVEIGILAWDPEAVTTFGADLSLPEPRPGLAAPDSVDAGVPFSVALTTIVPNGCWSAAGARIDRTATVVEITPFDRFTGGAGIACTDAIRLLPRTVVLRFDTPGSALLRIYARRALGRSLSVVEPIVIEHPIVVR